MGGRSIERRRFVRGAAAGCALGLLAFAGCAPDSSDSREKLTCCLEGAPDLYGIGIYVAQDRGLLEAEGLSLELVEPDEGSSALEMVNAGKAQFGLSSQEALARAFAVAEPASVIAVAAIAQHDITAAVPPALARTASFAKRDSYSTLVIANDAFLVNDPDVSRAFLEALSRGYRYAAAHPARAARVLCEALGGALDEGDAVREAKLLASQLLDAKGRWGTISQRRWDGFFSWLYEAGHIDRAIYAHHGYTLDYLPNSKQGKREEKSS